MSDPDLNINRLEFWGRPADERDATFTWLRQNQPVSWQDKPDPVAPELPSEAGFWSLVKHEDIRYVSRNPDKFTSTHGIFVDDIPALETILSFIVMDQPRHTALRGIVNTTFIPRNVRKMEDQIKATVRQIIDEVVPKGEGELCQLITKEVPGRVFAGFFGVDDPKRRQDIMDAAEQLGSWSDPEYAHIGSPLEVFQDAAARLQATAAEMAAERRAEPGDDLLTWILNAEYEGEKMTEDELGAFFCLLAGAANDTTRHSMAHVLITLQEHADARTFLFEDFEGRIDDAVNELLRWQAPLRHFRRVANEDMELRGHQIKQGDKLVMWYLSGNRDEDVFDDPFTFKIDRNPNPHQAFGGGGIHLCLGSALGKQMLKSEIWEIYTRMDNLEVGKPEYMLSNFMNGVMKLPGTWTPEKA
jgi:cytochrome P450